MCDFETHLFSHSLPLCLYFTSSSSGRKRPRNLSWQVAKKKTGEMLKPPNPANCLMQSFLPALSWYWWRAGDLHMRRRCAILILCWWIRAKRIGAEARSNTSEEKLICSSTWSAPSYDEVMNSRKFHQRLLEKSHFSDLFYSFSMLS